MSTAIGLESNYGKTSLVLDNCLTFKFIFKDSKKNISVFETILCLQQTPDPLFTEAQVFVRKLMLNVFLKNITK